MSPQSKTPTARRKAASRSRFSPTLSFLPSAIALVTLSLPVAGFALMNSVQNVALTPYVNVCHNGTQTLSVSLHNLRARLLQGDKVGPCAGTNGQVLGFSGSIFIDASSASSNASGLTMLCHSGQTLNVPQQDVAGHMGHGDTLGACGGGSSSSVSSLSSSLSSSSLSSSLSPSSGSSSSLSSLSSSSPSSLSSSSVSSSSVSSASSSSISSSNSSSSSSSSNSSISSNSSSTQTGGNNSSSATFPGGIGGNVFINNNAQTTVNSMINAGSTNTTTIIQDGGNTSQTTTSNVFPNGSPAFNTAPTMQGSFFRFFGF